MDNLMVSVIIPVYNGEKYLAETIESALAQSYRPLEIIVVDDGSTDRTAEIAQAFEVKYIFQPNQGHGVAKNTGILHAKGEYLAFLDADDLWATEKLSVQIGHLQKNPEIGFVICNMMNFLTPGYDRPAWLAQEEFEKTIPAYIPSALIVRRWVLEKIGNFDPGYQHANDTDWFFRALDAGIPMANVNQTLLHRRIHPDNRSHTHTPGSLSYRELFRSVKSSIDRKRTEKPTYE